MPTQYKLCTIYVVTLASIRNSSPTMLKVTRGHVLSTLVEGLPLAFPLNVAAEYLPSHPYYSFLYGNPHWPSGRA
jgi:hypothetical protein